ncbi:MAG: AI-2E family transporter [Planctomycetota bacterium]
MAGAGTESAPGAAPDEEVDAATIAFTTSQRLGQRLVRSVGSWFDENRGSIGAEIGTGAVEIGSWLVSFLARLAGTLFGLGFGAFLVLFFFFFFSTGLGQVKRFFERLVPRQNRKTVFSLASQMDAVIAAFIRGRLTIMAILATLFVVGYWLIGVPAPLLLGIGVGILSAVPYLSLVGVPVSIILMALEPGTGFQASWWWIVGAPIGVYMIVQATDDYIWTPLIQGKATDMDTPTILFAVLGGGVLFGIYGVLVAIPVAACLKILIREVVWPKVVEWVEGRSKDPLPIDSK